MYKKKENILIIGGNDAGLSAAGRAKRRCPDANVLVLEKTKYAGYASCGFPLLIDGSAQEQHLDGPDPDTIKQERGFKVLVEHNAININLQRRIVVAGKSNGDQVEFEYTKLLLATGASPVIPDMFSGNLQNVFAIRNYTDIAALDRYLQKNRSGNAVVIGGGYLGIEFADAFMHRGCTVTLVDKAETVLPGFDPAIIYIVQERLENAGIRLRLGEKNIGTEQKDRKILSISLASETIRPDFILAATGAEPNVILAERAGIPVGKTGAISVDNRMQTGRMNVYAAGDCVEIPHRLLKNKCWMPFAGLASKQGRIAGSNAVGGSESLPGALGTSMVSVLGLEFGKTGLTVAEAQAAGFDPLRTVITQPAKPGYIKKNAPVTVVLVHDEKSKRILGGQIAGEIQAGQRLNVLATAIYSGLTVKELAYLDLGYTPLITNMWDPVSVAGSAALKAKRKKS